MPGIPLAHAHVRTGMVPRPWQSESRLSIIDFRSGRSAPPNVLPRVRVHGGWIRLRTLHVMIRAEFLSLVPNAGPPPCQVRTMF